MKRLLIAALIVFLLALVLGFLISRAGRAVGEFQLQQRIMEKMSETVLPPYP